MGKREWFLSEDDLAADQDMSGVREEMDVKKCLC